MSCYELWRNQQTEDMSSLVAFQVSVRCCECLGLPECAGRDETLAILLLLASACLQLSVVNIELRTRKMILTSQIMCILVAYGHNANSLRCFQSCLKLHLSSEWPWVMLGNSRGFSGACEGSWFIEIVLLCSRKALRAMCMNYLCAVAQIKRNVTNLSVSSLTCNFWRTFFFLSI